MVKGWWPTTLVKRLAHRSFYRPSFDEVMVEKRSGSTAEMKRTLTGLDLLMFGVGARPPSPVHDHLCTAITPMPCMQCCSNGTSCAAKVAL